MGFNAYTFQVAISAGVLALVGLSVFIPWRAGLINLGASGFMAIGGYTSALLVMRQDLPIAAGVLAGALLASAAGVVIGLVVLRLEGVYLAVATLACSVVIESAAGQMEFTGGSAGLSRVPSIFTQVGSALYGRPSRDERLIVAMAAAALVWAVASLTMLLVALQRRSPFGQLIEALRWDRTASEAAGVDTKKVRLVAFVEGTFVAGLAGGLLAHTTNFVDATKFGTSLSLQAFIILILGGAASVLGPALGALLVSFLPEMLRFLLTWRSVVYGAVVVFILAVEPNGLVGFTRRLRSRFSR